MNESDMTKSLESLLRASALMKDVPPRERLDIDEIELVFVDNLNGKLKHRRAYTFMDIMKALEEGGKPIGLILLHWCQANLVRSKEMPDLTGEEQALLIHALAEAQDEVKHSHQGTGDDDD